MSKLFLYIVGANPNPDRIECPVPWNLGTEIFFGPCMKRLREVLRRYLVEAGMDSTEPRDRIYLAGVNGGNSEGERKIIWAGRVTRVMTFARAYQDLSGERYEKMRNPREGSEGSPLHVKPLFEDDRFIGYEHRDEGVHKDEWVLDLVRSRDRQAIDQAIKDNRLLLSQWEAFPRDACAVCKNLFFAERGGLDLDNEVLSILKRYHPDAEPYAIFGRQRNGRVNGLRGNYLLVQDQAAEELVAWIGRHASRLRGQARVSNATVCR